MATSYPLDAAGYCLICDRPLPDILPISGLCNWCEQAQDHDYCPECGEEHRGDCID